MLCIFSSKWLDRLSEVTGRSFSLFSGMGKSETKFSEWIFTIVKKLLVFQFLVLRKVESWNTPKSVVLASEETKNGSNVKNSHTAENDLRKSHFVGYFLAFGKKRETSCFQLRLFPTTFAVHVQAPATDPISDSNHPLSGRLTAVHFAPYSIPSNWMNISLFKSLFFAFSNGIMNSAQTPTTDKVDFLVAVFGTHFLVHPHPQHRNY